MPIYYHVSPEQFSHIRPRYSQKFRQKGLFVAPTLQAILDGWGTYVVAKRSSAWRRAREKRLEKRIAKTQQDIREPEGYQTVYLYKISIPHEVEKRAQQLYEQKAKRALEEFGHAAVSAWAWEKELFIPEEDLPRLTIEKCQKISSQELFRWITRHELKRLETINPIFLDREAKERKEGF